MPEAEPRAESPTDGWPKVSVILPTLNEASRLEGCLDSIRRQDYPQEHVEILVADGGSTDATVDIARRFECHVVDAAGLLAEAAKDKALRVADGGYLAMVDADNTIVGTAWLRLAVGSLLARPGALGFESYYAFEGAGPALNRYLTGLLQISDPWARAVAKAPELIEETAEGLEIFKLPRDGSYPTGANGFLFHRRHLDQLGTRPFHEATFFPLLIRAGISTLLKRQDCRVHHDYVGGWHDYFRKKQRVALHYLLRREEVRGGWDAELPSLRRWAAMLYCASVLGPAVEGTVNAVRWRRAEWLLHAPASFVAVAATCLGIVRSRLAGTRAGRTEASRSLKPTLQKEVSPARRGGPPPT